MAHAPQYRSAHVPAKWAPARRQESAPLTLAEQACRCDDDPDDERSQAGQQQDFMKNSAHLQPPELEDGITVPREPQFGDGHLVPRWAPETLRGTPSAQRPPGKRRVECLVQPRFRYAVAP